MENTENTNDLTAYISAITASGGHRTFSFAGRGYRSLFLYRRRISLPIIPDGRGYRSFPRWRGIKGVEKALPTLQLSTTCLQNGLPKLSETVSSIIQPGQLF